MNDLFIGAGKGIGAALKTARSAQGNQCYHISGCPARQSSDLQVNWHTVRASDLYRWLRKLPRLDMIFFNHNSSSLSGDSFRPDQYKVLDLWRQISHWKQSHWVSCQMPFEIIHILQDKIHANTRICWMLSSMILQHSHDLGHADYIANKFQNYMIMKNFAQNHGSCFLSFDPGNVKGSDHSDKITTIQDVISRPTNDINGRVFDMSGQESELFKTFR